MQEILSTRGEAEKQQARNKEFMNAQELSTEQNGNMLDGIPNNEKPRENQGYTVIGSETAGRMEFVLAENKNALQPYVTWKRDIEKDAQDGTENFFWGHYFCEKEDALKDLCERADKERGHQRDCRPSVLGELKRSREELTSPVQASGKIKHGMER